MSESILSRVDTLRREETERNMSANEPPEYPNSHAWALVARAAEGDMGAFGELAELYEERMMKFALGFGISTYDAEDIVQKALLTLIEKARKLRYQGWEPSAWLFEVEKNEIYDLWRRRKNAPLPFAALSADGTTQVDRLGHTDDTAKIAVEELLNEHRREIIKAALDAARPLEVPTGRPGPKPQLSPAQNRWAFALSYYGGATERQIATALGVEETTVHGVLQQTRERMQKWIMKNFPDIEEGRWVSRG